jgi:hypothetical protein
VREVALLFSEGDVLRREECRREENKEERTKRAFVVLADGVRVTRTIVALVGLALVQNAVAALELISIVAVCRERVREKKVSGNNESASGTHRTSICRSGRQGESNEVRRQGTSRACSDSRRSDRA